MVKSCCAFDCTTRYVKGTGISFHAFPTDEKRRALWIRALRRKDWQPSPYSVVCGKHFQTGRPKNDEKHPDYVPSLFSFTKWKRRNTKSFENRQKLHDKILLAKEATKMKEEHHNAMILKQSEATKGKEHHNAMILKQSEATKEKEHHNAIILKQSEANKAKEHHNAIILKQSEYIIPDSTKQGEILHNTETQFSEIISLVDLIDENKKLKAEIERIKSENNAVSTALEMDILKEKIKVLNNKLYLSDFSTLLLKEKKQLVYYTGVPHLNAFNWILSITVNFVEDKFNIATEKQLLIVLVKLRLALDDQDIAVRFNVSRLTVRRIIDAWLPILAGRLKCLIIWPSRKAIKKNMPLCFKNSVYSDAVCIIECTEVLTQRSSKDMQLSTVNILIAITLNGMICYVSDCWGDPVSNEEITLKRDILNYLKPGDLILADRGFNLAPKFQLEGIQIIVPSYTKGKKQLSQEEIPNSKKLSNVQIHVERMTGYIKKFKILTGIVPITTIKYLNCITRICAAIHNLWPSTVL